MKTTEDATKRAVDQALALEFRDHYQYLSVAGVISFLLTAFVVFTISSSGNTFQHTGPRESYTTDDTPNVLDFFFQPHKVSPSLVRTLLMIIDSYLFFYFPSSTSNYESLFVY